jgi:hypothetical protein
VKRERKWEYRVIDSVYPEVDLNAAAEEGWEFVQAVSFTTSGGAIRANHYFRREFVPPPTLLDELMKGGVGAGNAPIM